MDNYYLASDNGRFSADPADYFMEQPDFRFEGMTLTKVEHPYLTVSGRVVFSHRFLKRNPTLGDLQRLERAVGTVEARKDVAAYMDYRRIDR